jgi:photosystem II stability/assembly factor-like uncharacterized protein
MIEKLKLPGLNYLTLKRITFVVLLSIFVSNNSYSQPAWTWQTPTPTGNTLQSIKFVDVQTGYSCGNVGVILKTINGGQNWVALTTPKNVNYYGLDVTPNGIIVAVGDSSTIIRSSNGGSSWQIISSPVFIKFTRDIDFTDNNTGYIVGGQDVISPQGRILKTTDGGLSWFTQLIGGGNFHEVKFYNNSYGAAGGQNTFFITKNGGANWLPQSISFNPFNFVGGIAHLDTSTILFTIYDENVVCRTSNGGINWTKYQLDLPVVNGRVDYAGNISFPDFNTGYMVTESILGNILKTTNSGINWTIDSSYRFSNLLKIDMLNTSTGYACGVGGYILKTTNSAQSWNRQNGGYANINQNFFINQNTGFCAGDSGIILKTTNAGNNWITKTTNTTRKLNSIHFINDNIGYCAGDTGMVLKTINGGESWSALNTGVINGLNAIQFVDMNTGIAAGKNHVAIRTTDGGLSWSSQTISTSGDILSINFISPSQGFLTTESGIIKTTNSGINWFQVASTPNGDGRDVFFINSSTGYVVATQSRIYKTTNEGLNWVLQSTGFSGNRLTSVYFFNVSNGITIGDAGVIHKTSNGGTNWIKMPTITDNNLTSIYFTDANTGYITGEYGTLLKTTNGGLSFVNYNGSTVVSEYKIYQNYPNPFNPSTVIKYELPKNEHVMLKIFTITGKEIFSLVNEKQSSGIYEVFLDASSLPSGIYFYSLIIENQRTFSGRMVLTK